MKTIEVNMFFISFLDEVLAEMKKVAGYTNCTIKNTLNGVVVLVNKDSNCELILRDQKRAASGYITGPVGPYPEPEVPADQRGIK